MSKEYDIAAAIAGALSNIALGASQTPAQIAQSQNGQQVARDVAAASARKRAEKEEEKRKKGSVSGAIGNLAGSALGFVTGGPVGAGIGGAAGSAIGTKIGGGEVNAADAIGRTAVAALPAITESTNLGNTAKGAEQTQIQQDQNQEHSVVIDTANEVVAKDEPKRSIGQRFLDFAKSPEFQSSLSSVFDAVASQSATVPNLGNIPYLSTQDAAQVQGEFTQRRAIEAQQAQSQQELGLRQQGLDLQQQEIAARQQSDQADRNLRRDLATQDTQAAADRQQTDIAARQQEIEQRMGADAKLLDLKNEYEAAQRVLQGDIDMQIEGMRTQRALDVSQATALKGQNQALDLKEILTFAMAQLQAKFGFVTPEALGKNEMTFLADALEQAGNMYGDDVSRSQALALAAQYRNAASVGGSGPDAVQGQQQGTGGVLPGVTETSSGKKVSVGQQDITRPSQGIERFMPSTTR